MSFKVASFFAGCGGLDLGFEQAGYEIVWANEYDKTIHETYQFNHPNTYLCKKDIRTLSNDEIPDCDGFIGGPPCQPWSEGGKQLGLKDDRGKLFLDYLRLIKEKHPKFFIIENVKGIIGYKHFHTFLNFLSTLKEAGYIVNYTLLNAADYRVPQDRYRVFIVGFAKELNVSYSFPQPIKGNKVTLRQAIGDIIDVPNLCHNELVNIKNGKWINHDVYVGEFDAKFMARNRVRSWDDVSYTIQAQAKNCPLHPQAPLMKYVSANQRVFQPGKEHLYRRLSVRECARIQSFPDKYKFFYRDIRDGYKMVGNAVPPRLAKHLAISIKEALEACSNSQTIKVLVGYYKDEFQLKTTILNKLYYVRAGLRRGAMQFPVGDEMPKLLLLHHKNEKHLFSLSSKAPMLMSANELSNLGFKLAGEIYWAFTLMDTEELSINDFKIKELGGRNVTFPYITNVNDYCCPLLNYGV